MRVNRRRSDIEIIAEMLKIRKNGAGKTKIMYRADMSYSQTQKYLGFLSNQGFIVRMRTVSPTATYQTTESGLELLKGIDNVREMLGLDDDKYFVPDFSSISRSDRHGGPMACRNRADSITV